MHPTSTAFCIRNETGSLLQAEPKGRELPFSSEWGREARVFLWAGGFPDPNPEGSQEELSRGWKAWSTRAEVGGSPREEGHCLVIIREEHPQNPHKSAHTASVQGEPIPPHAPPPCCAVPFALILSSPLSQRFLQSQKMLLGSWEVVSQERKISPTTSSSCWCRRMWPGTGRALTKALEGFGL